MNWMNKLLALAAIAEAAAGLALLAVPGVVGHVLLGAELSGVAVPLARVTGIALIALGVACWPGCSPLCGMLTYSVLVTVYLAWVGFAGGFTGSLLWPAVGAHLVLTILLSRAFIAEKNFSASPMDSGKTPATESTKEPHP